MSGAEKAQAALSLIAQTNELLQPVVDAHNIITDPGEAVRELEKNTLIAFDTETTGFSPWRDKLALLQFYGDETGALAIIRTPHGVIPDVIRPLLENSAKTFIAHNGVSFDIPFIYTHGIDPFKATWYDTMVAETAIVPTGRRDVSVSLRASVKRRLGVEINKDIAHGGWDQEILSPEQLIYASSDVLTLPGLYRAQQERAIEAGVLEGLDMEQRLVPAVASMTITGMPFSVEKWREYIKKQHQDRDIAYDTLKEAIPEVKNWRSPKQIGEALVKRGIPLPKTKTGRPSTKAEVLEQFAK